MHDLKENNFCQSVQVPSAFYIFFYYLMSVVFLFAALTALFYCFLTLSQIIPGVDTDGETSGMGSSVDEPIESSTESASEAPVVTPSFLQPRPSSSSSRGPSTSPVAVKVSDMRRKFFQVVQVVVLVHLVMIMLTIFLGVYI